MNTHTFRNRYLERENAIAQQNIREENLERFQSLSQILRNEFCNSVTHNYYV